jgi:hypothetical protein
VDANEEDTHLRIVTRGIWGLQIADFTTCITPSRFASLTVLPLPEEGSSSSQGRFFALRAKRWGESD